MNKKITRRAVLGTTIAALAAGPFVMRAWRKGQNGLPVIENFEALREDAEFRVRHGYSKLRGELFDEWQAIYSKFDATFEKDDSVNVVTLRLNFSQQQKWNFRSLTTSILGKTSSLSDCAPNNLNEFDIAEGMITIDKDTINVSVDKREKKRWGIVEEASRKTGKKIIDSDVIKDGSITSVTKAVKTTDGSLYVEKIDTIPLENCGFVAREESNTVVVHPIDKNGCELTIMEAKKAKYPLHVVRMIWYCLMHSYPEDCHLAVNTTVDLPREKVLMSGLPPKAKLEHVGKVNNFRVAVFMSDCTYNTEQICEQYRDCSAFLQENNINGNDFYKKIIEEAVEQKREKRQILKNYVDLATGLTIYHETLVCDSTRLSIPSVESTVFQIS